MLVAIFLVFISGCSKSKTYTIDVNELADSIKNNVSFEDGLVLLEEDMITDYYPDVTMEKIKSSKVYVSSGATAQQIAVFEGIDELAAKQLKEELEICLADQIEMNENYLPKEVEKLKKPVLEVRGKYVIMVVSDYNSQVLTLVPTE